MPNGMSAKRAVGRPGAPALGPGRAPRAMGPRTSPGGSEATGYSAEKLAVTVSPDLIVTDLVFSSPVSGFATRTE